MNIVRWHVAFPLAVVASFIAYQGASGVIEAINPARSASLAVSSVEIIFESVGFAAPVVIFIMTGVLICPSAGRKVCFIFYGLSQLFSASAINFFIFGGCLGALIVIIVSGLIGLGIALSVANKPTASNGDDHQFEI
jgi:hypothetical protein